VLKYDQRYRPTLKPIDWRWKAQDISARDIHRQVVTAVNSPIY